MLAIRPFTSSDVPLGMRLKEQAGWNQLAADWRRMLDMQPEGSFVAEQDGRPAGTVMTCIFGGDVAWVAMMLVETSLRGKGIGRVLMEHALQFLDKQRVPAVRLDATPLGEPLYAKLGFVPEYSLARYAGEPTPGDPPAGVCPITRDLDELIYRVDHTVTRTDRRKFLGRLLNERQGWAVHSSGILNGYLLTRAGASATQIGPCIADDLAGPLLLEYAFSQQAGQRVYVDIPEAHEPAASLARQWGLTIQRHLLRMCRGTRIDEQIDRLWASSGPELG